MTFNQNFNDDPWAVDAEKVIAEQEQKGSGSGSKVKWHNLPEGDAMSTWRILPFTKRRSFFFKVTKHWHVPGFKGAITCPRSFDLDPNNPGKKYRCAVCEKFFEMYKSKDPAEQALAKQVLKASQSYYVNAVNMDKPEEGVGVLTLPYNVWKTLYDWLSVPRLQTFSHPFRGFNVVIKSSTTNAIAPGQTKPKREYTVMPDMPSEIADKAWLDALYDLETVVGIPTFELTEVATARLLAGDESVAKLPENTQAYVNRLALGSGDATPPNSVPPEAMTQQQVRSEIGLPPLQYSNMNGTYQTADMTPLNVPPVQTTGYTGVTVSKGVVDNGFQTVTTPAPAFASAPTASTLSGPAPDSKPVCFTQFNENDKKCLKCPVVDECEMAQLKAARAARQAVTAPVNTTPVTATPQTSSVFTTPASEDDVRRMMEEALAGSLKK